MEYRLAIKNNDNKYFDICGYAQIFDFVDFSEKKLIDITKFTTLFSDEIGLKQALLYKGIISKEELTGDFGIKFYKSKDSHPKILPYGVPFASDKKYFNYPKILNFYLANQKNIEFMDIFLDNYYYLKNIPMFSDLNYIFYSNEHLIEYGYLPEEANEALASFLKKYLYKKNKDGNYEIIFSKMYALAMLVINYKRKQKNKKTFKDLINDMQMELNHYESLLTDSAINDEQNEVYDVHINKLERKLKSFR